MSDNSHNIRHALKQFCSIIPLRFVACHKWAKQLKCGMLWTWTYEIRGHESVCSFIEHNCIYISCPLFLVLLITKVRLEIICGTKIAKMVNGKMVNDRISINPSNSVSINTVID